MFSIGGYYVKMLTASVYLWLSKVKEKRLFVPNLNRFLKKCNIFKMFKLLVYYMFSLRLAVIVMVNLGIEMIEGTWPIRNG